jgi:hypothetical protein
MDKDAKDLIDKLLQYIPEQRIGMRGFEFEGYQEIKSHSFFADIDFNALEMRTIKVPCFDLFSQTSDSDESSTKRDDSMKRRESQ